ncbi:MULTISPECIES: hypothetical protein [Halorussus]|uniref:DUF7344 domain-containing protein n=1 Tax=Halorussus TaxID=1070314 RepID=UPI000E214DE8|nr:MULTISPECIES: hypothetical protein [Halorussus]NHN61086.1 hypothetical protein [Halorussus sp. JP-T4]
MSDADSGVGGNERNAGPNFDAADDCTLNRAFDLLRDQRRRHALKTLYATDETVLSIDGLADRVLDRDPDAVDRDTVLVGLHHDTLPRLADAGVVDFDSRTETVRYRGSELLDDVLTVLDEE